MSGDWALNFGLGFCLFATGVLVFALAIQLLRGNLC
jgi:hypothetical protein